MYRWLRRLLVLTFAAVVFGAGGLGWFAYLHYTDPETIRYLILDLAAKNLRGAKLDLANVRGRLIGGLELNDIVLTELANETSEPLEEVFRVASCRIIPDHHRLLEGALEIRKAILIDPVIHLRQRPDGRWNLAKWISPEPIHLDYGSIIQIRNGSVQLEFADPGTPSVAITDIHLEMQLKAPSELTWSGTMAHPAAPQLRTTGRGNLATKTMHGDLATAAPADLATLIQSLPDEILELLGAKTRIAGNLMFQTVVETKTTPNGVEWSASCAGRVSGGYLEHERLPHAIEEVHTEFYADRSGLRVTEFRARCGKATAELTANIPQWDMQQAHGRGDIWNVAFDDALYESLPLAHQQSWERVSPQGLVDLHGSLRHSGDRWHLAGYADLHECSASFFKFPYRVREVEGRVVLHPDGHVSLQCQGKARRAPVTLTGTFSGIRPGTGIDLRLAAKGLRLDDDLLAALPPSVVESIGKLHADVRGDAVVTIRRPDAQGGPADWLVDLELAAPHFTSDWFQYPIENVRGRMAVSKHRTEFKDFMGTSAGSTIRMNGQLVKTTDGSHLELAFEGRSVPLDQNLYKALPPSVREAWSSVRPAGKVDLFCHLIKPPEMPLDISVRIDPGQASINPTSFPYPLEAMEGMIDYHGGIVHWEELQASHGRATLRCSGQVQPTENGGALLLRNLYCPQLPCDGDLQDALPEGLVTVVDFLQPDRPLEISFKEIDIRWFHDHRPIEYRFDGSIFCHQSQLIPAVGVESASGGVFLRGQGVGDHVLARGNLELAAARIAGFSLNNVASPIEIKGSEIRLGNILGEIYGGKLYGRLLVDTSIPGYDCHLTASNASLGRYLRDVMPKSAPVDGLVQVVLYLRNGGDDIAKLQGDGRLFVREADIYQSPIIQEVFRLLNFQAPNGRAFDEVDCNFRLKDRYVLIDSLELLGPTDIVGPSLSLFSDQHGSLDLDTMNIDLRLHPRWAKGRVKIPLLSDVMNTASDQLITIPVKGPISDPTLTAEPVPGLRRIFEGPVRPAYPSSRR